MEINPTEDGFAFTNRHGTNMMERLATLEDEVKRFSTDNTKVEAKLTNVETKLGYCEAEIDKQNQLSAGFVKIRASFLDVYKRDFLKATGDLLAISPGNIAAHHGDCVADSTLYNYYNRADDFTYATLYGFSPTRVSKLHQLGNDQAISILNMHATYIADKDRNLPQSYHASFDRYLTAQLQDLSAQPSIAAQGQSRTELRYAYDSFRAAHNAEPR